jgi:hypothetical protein
MILGRDRCCQIPIKKDVIGSQGHNGFYGAIGEFGNTGSTGNSGFQGATGLCYRGYNGPQGAKGFQGSTNGPQGLPGPNGFTNNNIRNSINCNFNFEIKDLASFHYSSNFINLTNFANSYINNSVRLKPKKYIISFSIYESWSDPNNNFFIMLNNNKNNKNTTFMPEIFNLNLPCVLSSTNKFITFSGNDIIDLTLQDEDEFYSIELFQSTISNNRIVLSRQKVKFNITFIPLS